MNTAKHLAVDASGGDGGVRLVVPACLQALQQDPQLHVLLVGDARLMQPLLQAGSAALRQRISVIHTDQAVADRDRPRVALRSARQSSMFRATQLVQQGDAGAMVSAGNSGALLMMGRHLLKTLPGIQKPAMVASLPGASCQTLLLDVGANPVCNSRQLLEFAVMGSVLAESLNQREARVGLLNIGVEDYKGTGEVQQAAQLLASSGALHYVGFVEADELFEGAADVVVCDGFVGNVTIKSSAGVANVVNRLLAAQLQGSSPTTAPDHPSRPALDRLTAQINPQRFNGASLLGLQGSVVKSHGNATREGFFHAIRHAVREVENAVPQLIAERVATIMRRIDLPAAAGSPAVKG